jgi:tetratricopeptide (TPR) repeat protein
MTTEEIINKIRSLARQRCHRNIKKMTLSAIFFGILSAGIYCGVFFVWGYCDWWIIHTLMIFSMCLVMLFAWSMEMRKWSLKVERNNYHRVENSLSRICKDSSSFFDRGCVFDDYGFYETALEDFDRALEYFNKESEQIAEFLKNFFDEYNAQTKFVNGIHRPVPNFRNHDWLWLRECHQKRKTLLEKMGKLEDAELENEHLKTITTLIEENNTITEKYWKGYGEYY